ncbi:hypothetical protein PLICBS_000320 [Purpureocillium lilacinum]|uniref:uncharacterized protein n=1 Tax=Purpureocillium lilacinum TaxID=33203 RepID=UPI0020812E6B|nr:hypothetical protein PLICBS_000320 [Purpureocillium lilacinum]
MASPLMAPQIMHSWFPWTQKPLILSAPMYGVSNATLAVEVSKAGGFGIIPAGFNFSPGHPQVVALEAELILARKLLGMTSEPGKQMPVGVGFITCHETVAHFSETVLPLLEEHKPAAVWLFAPDPASRVRAHPDIIRRLHESGIKAIVQVGSVAAAREAIQDGSDIIVAQGTDAGGHQFALGAGLMTLVPEIRAMMQAEFPARQVGLVAAGGIMNGGGVVAALALGAEAVVQGTRFIVAKESTASESYKGTVLRARDGGAITIKSTIHDDIQGTPIWPSLYDGRAIMGDSYHDHEGGLPMVENIKKYQDAKQSGDVSRSITWWLNTPCYYEPRSNSPSTAPSDSPDLIATRSSSESRTVDAWTTLEYSSHEPDALSRRLKLDWRQTASLYFQTVHPWFSILRQDKFEEALLRLQYAGVQSERGYHDTNSSPQDDAYELLIICMHLLTTTAHTHGDDDIIVNPLYQNAKQRFASVSYLSDPTLEWIQAGLLISLFEFGNGKTKLAYRSLSETATLARLAGVNPGQYQKDLHSEFDVDAECRRALWWGIFILDQFAHLDPALRNLPSLSSSPDNDALLPTAGVVVDGDRLQSYVVNLPVSAPVSIALGGFQRAAQAATVLYQAREWERRVRQGDADRGVSSFEDLDGRIRALLDAMLSQCHSCDEAKAVAAIGFAVKFVGDLAVNFNSQISQHALRLANLAPPAPFACFLAVEHMHVVEGDLPDSSERYLEIFETLKTFGKRWKVAADLLDLALISQVNAP